MRIVDRTGLDRTWAVTAIAIAVVGAALFLAARPAGPDTVEIAIRYSRFAPAEVIAPAGRPVTFVLRNDDPIDHEWIVGPEDVHERHRSGTEPVHDARPTEISIAALSSRRTTITFDAPGTYRFICHLPGHEAYGMVGTLMVVDS